MLAISSPRRSSQAAAAAALCDADNFNERLVEKKTFLTSKSVLLLLIAVEHPFHFRTDLTEALQPYLVCFMRKARCA